MPPVGCGGKRIGIPNPRKWGPVVSTPNAIAAILNAPPLSMQCQIGPKQWYSSPSTPYSSTRLLGPSEADDSPARDPAPAPSPFPPCPSTGDASMQPGVRRISSPRSTCLLVTSLSGQGFKKAELSSKIKRAWMCRVTMVDQDRVFGWLFQTSQGSGCFRHVERRDKRQTCQRTPSPSPSPSCTSVETRALRLAPLSRYPNPSRAPLPDLGPYPETWPKALFHHPGPPPPPAAPSGPL